jgi:hypothetical protein
VSSLPPPEPQPREPGRLIKRTATVVGVSPLTINLGGVPVAARRLTSYAPTVGDYVLVLVDDGDLVVLGELTT